MGNGGEYAPAATRGKPAGVVCSAPPAPARIGAGPSLVHGLIVASGPGCAALSPSSFLTVLRQRMPALMKPSTVKHGLGLPDSNRYAGPSPSAGLEHVERIPVTPRGLTSPASSFFLPALRGAARGGTAVDFAGAARFWIWDHPVWTSTMPCRDNAQTAESVVGWTGRRVPRSERRRSSAA